MPTQERWWYAPRNGAYVLLTYARTTTGRPQLLAAILLWLRGAVVQHHRARAGLELLAGSTGLRFPEVAGHGVGAGEARSLTTCRHRAEPTTRHSYVLLTYVRKMYARPS